MSATGRGAIKKENDFYETPDWCAKLIADRIKWEWVALAFEPCAGDGAIIKSCPDGIKWETCEIRHGKDYFDNEDPACDLKITNPPFNLAFEFLVKALSSLDSSACVVFLTRLNFLGSRKRHDFLSLHPPTHQYVLSDRPSFVDVCKGVSKKGFLKIEGCGKSYDTKDNIKFCTCGGKVSPGTDATEYAWFCWENPLNPIMLDKPGFYFLKKPF